MLASNLIHYHEANVVALARVFGARIAKAHKQLHEFSPWCETIAKMAGVRMRKVSLLFALTLWSAVRADQALSGVRRKHAPGSATLPIQYHDFASFGRCARRGADSP